MRQFESQLQELRCRIYSGTTGINIALRCALELEVLPAQKIDMEANRQSVVPTGLIQLFR